MTTTSTQTFTGTLHVIECYKCNSYFGISDYKYRRCRDFGESFFCPNGHSQIYTQTELDRVKQQLKSAKEDAAYYQRAEENERQARFAAERSARAQKAAKTRIKNRIAKGVCPCCNRHFANLGRHMKTQHPDFASVEQSTAGKEGT